MSSGGSMEELDTEGQWLTIMVDLLLKTNGTIGLKFCMVALWE